MWFDKRIYREAEITQIIEEIQRFSDEFFVNRSVKILNRMPFGANIPKVITNQKPFVPKGVIINVTQSPSITNSLELYTRNLFCPHFLICSSSHMIGSGQSYPLLNKLPATILMLKPLNQASYHAGYMSLDTWGIDIRNMGMVRPYLKGRKGGAPRLYETNIKPNHFVSDAKKVNLDFYWRYEGWKHLIENDIFISNHQNNWYEMITSGQLVTLIVLIRVLSFITRIDPRIILPGHALYNQKNHIPYLNMEDIRKAIAFKKGLLNDEGEYQKWIQHMTHTELNKPSYEHHDLDSIDLDIDEQLRDHKWRAEIDRGQRRCLAQKFEEWKSPQIYKSHLKKHGFDGSNLQLAGRMFALSKDRFEVTDAQLEKMLYRHFVQGIEK